MSLAKLHWELARALIDRRDFMGAMTECKVLGTLPGQAAEGHACAAEAHLLWQRSTEALGETALALAKDPRCYEAKVAEARAYEFAIDPGKSEAAYRAAIALQADGVEAHLGLGKLLAHERAARRGRERAPARRAARSRRTRCALRAGSGARARRREREPARARDARAPLVRRRVDRARQQQLAAGHVAEARKAGDEALRADASTVKPYLLLGRVALADNRPRTPCTPARPRSSSSPTRRRRRCSSPTATRGRGRSIPRSRRTRPRGASTTATRRPWCTRPRRVTRAGRDTSARAFGAKAAQEFPKWGPAWAALGDALAAQGEKPSARDAYQKALAGEGPVDKAAVQRKLDALAGGAR